MNEQDWKNIIDELTEQLKTVSIERAVARADTKRAAAIIESLQGQLEEANKKLDEQPIVQEVTGE